VETLVSPKTESSLSIEDVFSLKEELIISAGSPAGPGLTSPKKQGVRPPVFAAKIAFRIKLIRHRKKKLCVEKRISQAHFQGCLFHRAKALTMRANRGFFSVLVETRRHTPCPCGTCVSIMFFQQVIRLEEVLYEDFEIK